MPNHLDALENCHFPSASNYNDAISKFENLEGGLF